MDKYLDPKNDLVFKKIFGGHPDILKSFLNALLPFEEGTFIVELEYLPPELVPATPDRKNSLPDVRCRDNLNREFIVEMQMYWSSLFGARIVYNAAKAYVNSLSKGEDYDASRPVFTLAMLNDIFRKDTDDFYHHYAIVDTSAPERKLPGLEFVLIELPKFKPEAVADKKTIALWLRFMTEIKDSAKQISEDFNRVAEIRKAAEMIRYIQLTKEELENYQKLYKIEKMEKKEIEERVMIAREEALEEGEKKGRMEGEKKGRMEGEKKGRREGILAIVRNLLSMGLSHSEIAKMVMLSEGEVAAIARS